MPPADSVRRSFGRRVRQLRDWRDWTQEELAVKAHMDTKSLGAIERGERNVTLENVAKIARGLGVELRQLFLFDGKGPASAEDMAEDALIDALKTLSPRKKLLLRGLVNEVVNFPDR
ncbi:MAG: helix-turn-helix transcriptional regulator [Candidatus Brocadiae bacterium]|nr:helix-turn-helix transcriptional regulator [Candidatus Brocadiia bacterium]